MPRIHNEKRTTSSTYGAMRTGYTHAKEWNCTFILHHTEQSTQNVLKTEI